ncbi:hypothetical protein R6Q59_032649 [Mikania micrantha]
MSKNSATGYGTIPNTAAATASTGLPPQSPPKTLISRARYHTEKFIAKRRPWREFFNHTTITPPRSYDEGKRRIKQNLNYFRVNYAMVNLLILFLSLIFQPISMITFLIVFIGWFFLYFFRDPQNPVVIFSYVFDDRVVLMALSLLTLIALAFTDVEVILLVAVVVGAVVVVVHAGIRSTDDLFLDEQDPGNGDLISVVNDK